MSGRHKDRSVMAVTFFWFTLTVDAAQAADRAQMPVVSSFFTFTHSFGGLQCSEEGFRSGGCATVASQTGACLNGARRLWKGDAR